MQTLGKISVGFFAALLILGMYALGAISIAGWGYAIFTAAKAEEWGWFVIDLLIVPFGVVHGWGIFFGWWG